MAGRKSMKLEFKFLFRINKDDRKIIDDLQEHGLNITDEFRRFIRETHKKIINNEKM